MLTKGKKTDALQQLLDEALTLKVQSTRKSIFDLLALLGDMPTPIHILNVQALLRFGRRFCVVIERDREWFHNAPNDASKAEYANDVGGLYMLAAEIFFRCVTHRREWSADDQNQNLHKVATFATLCYGAAIKWAFLQQQPAPLSAWHGLHQLYTFAEPDGIADKVISIFSPETPTTQTISSIYIRTLMLDMFSSGSISVPQVEIADAWLAEWAISFSLTRTAAPTGRDTPHSQLVVDLASNAGLKLGANTQVADLSNNAQLRYLHLHHIATHLQELQDRMRAGLAYNNSDVCSLFPIEEHVSLLEKVERLQRTLLDAGRGSIDVRQSTSAKVIDVVVDLAAIFNALSHAEFGGQQLSLENDNIAEANIGDAMKPQSKKPDWTLIDISAGGLGLATTVANASSIRLGKLVAAHISESGTSQWLLCIVARRVESNNRIQLGLEILSRRITPVTLRISQSKHENKNSDRTQNSHVLSTLDIDLLSVYDLANPTTATDLQALYLSADDDSGAKDQLLVTIQATDTQQTNDAFILDIDNSQYTLQFIRSARRGLDWVAYRFKVLARG